MASIAVHDRDAGLAGLYLAYLPYPHAAENDVIVRAHAAGLTRGELSWAGTWTDRAGRDRTPSVPGHKVSGVATELGCGTPGLTVGQRVVGLADWSRNGTLAEYVAVEARNPSPTAAGVDHALATSPLPNRPRSSLRTGGRSCFVVEADRSQLGELGRRPRDGRLTSNMRTVRPLAEARTAFGPDAPRGIGKTIIQVTEGW